MKEEWKKVKLGEICEITSSKRFHLSERTTSGIPFYCTKEILLKLKGEENFECDYIAEKFYEEIKTKFGVPESGDLLLTTRGTVGYPYLYRKTDKFYFADGNLSWFKNFSEKLDSHFLYYWFLSVDGKSKVDSIAKGTAQKAVPITGLGILDITLPPLPTQQKIVSILSAYDDHIENNRKQIKLLEEAAQKLYKEWFVKLNFPGHETTKIVDGIPEGWKETTVGNLCGKLESGSRPKGGIDSSLTEGIASVGAENVIGLGQYNYASEKIVPLEYFEKAKRGIIEDKDILIYKDGAYIGKTSLFQDSFPHSKTMINEHVFLLHSKNEEMQYFIFFTLYQRTYFEKMQKLNKNAAQPGINQDAIKSLKLLVPTDNLIIKYNKIVEPNVKRIFTLAKQNTQLQSARDKLLPKLMNGELEV